MRVSQKIPEINLAPIGYDELLESFEQQLAELIGRGDLHRTSSWWNAKWARFVARYEITRHFDTGMHLPSFEDFWRQLSVAQRIPAESRNLFTDTAYLVRMYLARRDIVQQYLANPTKEQVSPGVIPNNLLELLTNWEHSFNQLQSLGIIGEHSLFLNALQGLMPGSTPKLHKLLLEVESLRIRHAELESSLVEQIDIFATDDFSAASSHELKQKILQLGEEFTFSIHAFQSRGIQLEYLGVYEFLESCEKNDIAYASIYASCLDTGVQCEPNNQIDAPIHATQNETPTAPLLLPPSLEQASSSEAEDNSVNALPAGDVLSQVAVNRHHNVADHNADEDIDFDAALLGSSAVEPQWHEPDAIINDANTILVNENNVHIVQKTPMRNKPKNSNRRSQLIIAACSLAVAVVVGFSFTDGVFTDKQIIDPVVSIQNYTAAQGLNTAKAEKEADKKTSKAKTENKPAALLANSEAPLHKNNQNKQAMTASADSNTFNDEKNPKKAKPATKENAAIRATINVISSKTLNLCQTVAKPRILCPAEARTKIDNKSRVRIVGENDTGWYQIETEDNERYWGFAFYVIPDAFTEKMQWRPIVVDQENVIVYADQELNELHQYAQLETNLPFAGRLVSPEQDSLEIMTPSGLRGYVHKDDIRLRPVSHLAKKPTSLAFASSITPERSEQ